MVASEIKMKNGWKVFFMGEFVKLKRTQLSAFGCDGKTARVRMKKRSEINMGENQVWGIRWDFKNEHKI